MITETRGVQGGILVTDFDGTMTRHDFYQLAIESLIPTGTLDYWAQYRLGLITHFEALRQYFASIRVSEREVMAVIERMELDPKLPAAIDTLRRAGWKVVVASAGCDWYIHYLLAVAGVSIEVHANPGQFRPGNGLVMDLPRSSPFLSSTLGINKCRVVQHFLAEGRPVAFAGDGFPDVDPARLVPDDLRFARGDLANVLQAEGLNFQRFDTWSDIARVLLKGND